MKVLLHIVSLLALALLITGCTDKPKKITGEQFQWQYENAKMETMHVSTYLGERDGKVYISTKSMSSLQKEWTEKIIYAEMSDLNPEFRKTLKSIGKKVDESRL